MSCQSTYMKDGLENGKSESKYCIKFFNQATRILEKYHLAAVVCKAHLAKE